MKKMSETIVFFGSGPVAAASLRLLARDFNVDAVVTKPQPEHHKEAFPVLELAHELGLKTFTPSNKRELSELFASRPVSSRLGVVIDYGIIINQDVIDYFPLGIVNSHFSLLPEWRGADPITFAVLSGQPQTGVSLMLIVAAMDEGPLLAQATYDMPADITTPQLTADLIDLSYQTLAEILPAYASGDIVPVEQSTSVLVTYSRKLSKTDGVLDFTKPATTLEREVRAYLEWPRSRTQINGIDVIVTAAHVAPGFSQPGELYVNGKQLGFYTADGLFIIDRLIPAGKREMPAAAFLAGYKLD